MVAAGDCVLKHLVVIICRLFLFRDNLPSIYRGNEDLEYNVPRALRRSHIINQYYTLNSP